MVEDPKDTEKLALLAHDLRTPLAAMRTAAELIGQGGLSPRQSAYLDVLIRSIDALSDMTGELVLAAQPGLRKDGEPKDAVALVRDVTDLFRHTAEGKGLTYQVSLAGSRALIKAENAAPLRRVITTLIDNAIKYTVKGSIRITLTLASPKNGGGASLKISVADTGPGIESAERARLFSPFVRGQTGRESGEGAGLGLWGAAQLVKEFGGKLRLITPKFGGCRFEVTMSLALDPEAAGEAVETDDGEDMAKVAGGHVLIVDDNATNRRLLAALLESFGMTSDQAENGPEALEMVTAGNFDAVLLDLHMPGMSGLEVSQRLQEVREGAKLPLIAVTATMEAVGDKRLRDAGFLEVLTKPLSPVHLFQALEHAREFHNGARTPDAPLSS